MIPRHLAAFCFVLFGAVLMQACGQGDGQVCQVPGDCAPGLDCLCRVGTGARGLCRAPGSTMCTTGTDSGPVDAFVAPVVDSSIDANVDANVDAFSVDTGSVDTGSVDTGSVDTGPDANADAGTDANTIDAGSDASSDANVDANVDAP
jgi:hypothetical protein